MPHASILEFPLGLPGFESHHQFTLTEQTPALFVLKSEESPIVRFYTVPVSILDPEYQFDISEEQARLLALSEESVPSPSVLGLAILAAAENGSVSANLLAPILANLDAGIAIQAVRSDARYSHRHPVIDAPGEEKGC